MSRTRWQAPSRICHRIAFQAGFPHRTHGSSRRKGYVPALGSVSGRKKPAGRCIGAATRRAQPPAIRLGELQLDEVTFDILIVVLRGRDVPEALGREIGIRAVLDEMVTLDVVVVDGPDPGSEHVTGSIGAGVTSVVDPVALHVVVVVGLQHATHDGRVLLFDVVIRPENKTVTLDVFLLRDRVGLVFGAHFRCLLWRFVPPFLVLGRFCHAPNGRSVAYLTSAMSASRHLLPTPPGAPGAPARG